MNKLRRVLPYLRPYSALVGVSGGLILVGTTLGLLAPWPLKVLIDNVLEGDPLPPFLSGRLGSVADDVFSLMIVTVIAGLFITVAKSAVSVLDQYVNAKVREGLVLDVRTDLFEHAQRLSIAYHEERRAGKLLYTIMDKSDGIARLVTMIPVLVQSALTLVGMFWITLKIDRTLALLSLTVVPFFYISVSRYIHWIQNRVRKVKGMEAEALSMIQEAMAMLRVVVAFGGEGREYRRVRRHGEKTADARIELTGRQVMFTLAVNTTTAAGTALVLGVGAHGVMQGRLTVGQLLVVMAYIGSVYTPLEAISKAVASMQRMFFALQMAFDVFDTVPEISDDAGTIRIKRAKGHIVFDHVSFSHKGRRKTIKDVSFEVEPGQTVGLVGPTGAGKTTLVSLLPRFYDPSEGGISIDGVALTDVKLKSLRRQISIVPQEALLFSGSVADNIGYGRFQADEAEIIAAAKAASAHDFIMRLPKGYETQLGDRGALLSGGERQRLAIARAILKDAPILLLDEPTSSVDVQTEAEIMEALERLMEGRTTLFVTHRLAAVRNADKIVVVKGGRIAAEGSHDELMASKGPYRKLVRMQGGAPKRVQRPSE